jgi:hypothetical protein
MPSKKSSSGSSQHRAQGGGRTANSEPKLQVFRDFAGINFEHANRLNGGVIVDSPRSDPGDQTDLQMNFSFLQNNVAVVSNKTLETRDSIVELFDAPSGVDFTGPVCLIEQYLYAAKSDGNVGVARLGGSESSMSNVSLSNKTGSNHQWTSLDYYDGKLIAMTAQNELWTARVSNGYVSESLENAKMVPNPNDFAATITGVGIRIAYDMTDECPFRVEVAYSYVNKYGPTRTSPSKLFYASKPVSEWHAGAFARISGSIPSGYGIKAVELYYTTDNAMSLLFLGRVDVASNATNWTYNWYGYIDATSMWPTANLIAPTAYFL